MSSQTKSAKIEKDDKPSELNNILLKFRNEKFFDELVEAAHDIDRGDRCMNARLLRIKFADAQVCTNFTETACYTNAYSSPTIAFGTLFTNGLEVLKRYIDTCSVEECLPDDSSSKTALMMLVVFLMEGVPDEFYQPDGFTDRDWSVFLIQHVLAKLTLSTDITINQTYHNEKQHILSKGTCSTQDDLVVEFGDTSFGCGNGWHGSADILIENDLPASVLTQSTDSVGSEVDDEDDRLSDVSESDDETSASADQDEMQLLSQCIVYSFLQAKRDRSLKNHLIPSLGISKRKLKVVFYDCENDILITTADLSFTDKTGKFNPVVALLLWLTLNYKLFCTGLPDSLKHCKANFNEWAGEKIKHYKDDVTKPVYVGKREERSQEWAKARGINPKPVFDPSWKVQESKRLN